jgi:hypothetical protein
MREWFTDERAAAMSPFEVANGRTIWETIAAGRSGEIFNAGMAADSRFTMDNILRPHSVPVFLCVLRSVLRGVLGENTNHPKHYSKHYKTPFTQNTCQNTCLEDWFYKLVYSNIFNTNG